MELKDRKIGEVFTIEGDSRIFKAVEHDGSVYCVYALQDEASDGQPLRWRMDYDAAKSLIDRFSLYVENARVIHAVSDNIYMSAEAKKESGFFRNFGIRYIAEATIRKGTDAVTRTASAGADNVGWQYASWCPDIACKRAIIKCVIDILKIKEVEPEIVPMPKAQVTGEAIDKAPAPATPNQISAIKGLMKAKKWDLKKAQKQLKLKFDLDNLSELAAETLIGKLQEGKS
jgi:hypothetical protein